MNSHHNMTKMIFTHHQNWLVLIVSLWMDLYPATSCISRVLFWIQITRGANKKHGGPRLAVHLARVSFCSLVRFLFPEIMGVHWACLPGQQHTCYLIPAGRELFPQSRSHVNLKTSLWWQGRVPLWCLIVSVHSDDNITSIQPLQAYNVKQI